MEYLPIYVYHTFKPRVHIPHMDPMGMSPTRWKNHYILYRGEHERSFKPAPRFVDFCQSSCRRTMLSFSIELIFCLLDTWGGTVSRLVGP